MELFINQSLEERGEMRVGLFFTHTPFHTNNTRTLHIRLLLFSMTCFGRSFDHHQVEGASK